MFFYLVVGLFILQAAWIALSSLYPMAFDEEFHLGIIRLYAHHISPFWSSQPAHADAFGPVYRDPSYLYHWLMSFPYRLISVFTKDVTIQIILLRFINIGLMAAALLVWRRVLLAISPRRSLVHLVLLVFVLIPVLPLLAGQINYDNLFILIVACTLLLALRVQQKLTTTHELDARLLCSLVVLCLLGSLIKYAFLPIVTGVVVWLLIVACRQPGRRKLYLRSLAQSWRALGNKTRLALILLVFLSCALFVERYGVNMVRYHAVVPDCAKVLSVESCSHYGPWNRDYQLALNHWHSNHNPAVYSVTWFKGMYRRLFFTLAGPSVGYQTQKPLLLPTAAAFIVSAIGFVLSLVYSRRIWRKAAFGLPLLAAVIYVVAVFFDNYKSYVHTGGVPVSINGRYLLAVLPVFMLFVAMAFDTLLANFRRVKLWLCVLVVGCFFVGWWRADVHSPG